MKKPTWPAVRDGVLFFVGITGVIYVTCEPLFFHRDPDYGLLPIFAGFAGSPLWLGRDERKGPDRNDNSLPGG